MKQCPVCKTTYTDDSLRFCLADGANLSFVSESKQPTLVSHGGNPVQVNVPQSAAPTSLPTIASPDQKNKRRAAPFVIAALIGLLLLATAGIAAIILLNPFGKTNTVQIANNSNNTRPIAVNAATPGNEAEELQEKIANLERLLKDQTNQKKTSNVQPSPFPSPQNNSGVPTARVKKTNDGFLSLRTEPSVKTGTQLVKIPSGATVQLENCQKTATIVDGQRGRWCIVSYNGETGWVFNAWLIY